MSLRQFPLRKTCQNLYFNIKNFNSPNRRPVFKSTNHPFCTNTQLLDASYTNWLKESSRKIPSKIINHLQEANKGSHNGKYQKRSAFEDISRSAVFCHQLSNSFIPTPGITFDDEVRVETTQPSKPLTENIHDLFQRGDLALSASKLEEAKKQSVHMDPEVLLQLIEQAISKHPQRIKSLNDCEIEHPFHLVSCFGKNVSYYGHIEKDFKHLYRICDNYRDFYLNNQRFQEIYIRICYHMDSIDSLQHILYFYLRNKKYDSNTLAYVMSGFILNYEVEFSKSLFYNILSSGRHLEQSLFDCIIHKLIEVDCLYENLLMFFELWTKSDMCEKPSAKSVSWLLKEILKFGNDEEIQMIMEYILANGYQNHFMISSVVLQSRILKYSRKKNVKDISQSDISEIESIIKKLRSDNDIEALSEFYSVFLSFASKYLSFDTIQYFVSKMKEDQIELREDDYKSISTYYAKNERCLQVFAFLKHTSSKIQYEDYYLKCLFESFVHSYPYNGMELAESFHRWIGSNQAFSVERKKKLISGLKVCKLESKLTPYNIDIEFLPSRKYDPNEWKKLQWKVNKFQKHIKFGDQVNFRINKGFRDLLRKGVRPDRRIIEETFRRSNVEDRKKIRELLKALRLLDKTDTKLQLYDLQLNSSKHSINAFLENNSIDSLTSSNLIFLSRILMNKRMYELTNQSLAKVDFDEINDRSKMVKLNIELRNHLSFGRYKNMIEAMDNFPINEIVLSPYLYNQCRYIEKQLLKNFRKSKASINSSDEDKLHEPNSIDFIEETINRIRGLIGDIVMRVEKDKFDVRKEVENMFSFLDSWIASSKIRDERKI